MPGKGQELLTTVPLLRVATLSSKGDPFITPTRFHFDGENLYFVSPEGSRLLRHVRANRRLALLADSMEGRELEGVVIQGLAQFVRGQAESERVLEALRERYPEHAFDGTLVKVVPLRVLDSPGER